ncbi:transcription-repair coupling factor [Dorea formicigenerans]|uniref:Transcription-repair-coupling factor n=1 Tax=Dorea formicigenerans ATCC 27755 TaxID=411461 RepID=B0G3N8_9FIRM|nr:transcription-repair coupling factor [Dorea formicigenerans]EDR47782.1 transcription-repair coupling factor [Dorea formicigenerans ATCC 27755]UWP21004.1 transcription-repair coupling factor [Dorea formicigenerans]
MQALLKPLLELAEYEDIVKKKKEAPGVLMLTGCVNSQKTHMMYALSDGCCYKVIACSSEAKAKQIYEEYRFLDAAISFYPAKDLLFYQADIRSKELVSQRMQVIQAVLKGEPITVVASFDAFMDALLPKEMIKSRVIKICSDETLNLDELSVKLAQCGYDREIEVAGPGQFAVRGGILDVYPLTEELPVRIELWGDEVDSIRTFDPETQRSIEKLDEVEVFPATEFPEEEEKRVSFLDYFEKENTILFLDEPVRLKEKGEGVEEEFLEAQKRRAQSGYEVADSEAVLFTTQEIMGKMNEYSSVGFQALDMRCPGLNIRASYSLQTKNVDPYNRSFELLTQDLKKMKRNQSRVILLSGSRTRARRLAEDLRDYNLSSFYSEDMDREVEPGEIMTAYGYIAEGYEYPLLNFVVISETDIFGKKKKKKRRTTYEGRKIQSFSELKPGDYVVHENHGLGIYQGIEKIEVDKISKDYMKISYAKGGNLYIPATQLDLIQKYAGSDSKKPKLNRLGTQEWTKTKAKVRGAVKEIAKDLVELYAARQNQDGFVYGEDTVWQKEFEEMFPYEETEDQLLAINAVKKDMESHKIMDRLICGDVGYGKTEIAIRAAFKAVQENKQVVYLVPTTILAQQHYNTFCQRMKDFPVRVDLMCRFRTPAQQRDTIQNLKRGLVDIVVGTHRVLSDDIEYKDLGLLIIDEEQRFGVQHKEKIKKLKKNVDVLTLTATPIPRTLHMSLIGIRDMSVLEEAPQDRLPIQTYVMEYNDEMVREAIERECARNGQVYYVYNRVEDIAEVTAHIQKLVPELNVSFAHGQMKEHELEKIMYDFINGDIDVLVSTTIIETGLDISNVNTMIIHDADRLGLSQLYQLRGRVGRSGRMAYAFLLYRKDKLLKEIAEKRLAAIREFTDLGSGFKIAMRDLEIRGAGNLLGAEQHGHMEAVGYDMYCKMLNEAVKHLKGELSEEDTFTTALDVNVDAYIPDSYIPNEYHKLDIYKRIAAIESEEEMDDMIEELIDRFGDIPKKVELLLEVARLKNLAHQAYVTEVTQKGVTYTFRMYEKAKIHVERIPDLLKQFPEDLSFKADISDPKFIYQRKKKTKRGEVENPIEVVKKVLIGIKGLLD